jgi:hypothetical protein
MSAAVSASAPVRSPAAAAAERGLQGLLLLLPPASSVSTTSSAVQPPRDAAVQQGSHLMQIKVCASGSMSQEPPACHTLVTYLVGYMWVQSPS